VQHKKIQPLLFYLFASYVSFLKGKDALVSYTDPYFPENHLHLHYKDQSCLNTLLQFVPGKEKSKKFYKRNAVSTASTNVSANRAAFQAG
jgi:hypothetical protein